MSPPSLDPRPLASLSLDLDDHWSYLKTHGDPAWKSWPSYLGRVVPRFLSFLRQRGLAITVFIVGKDAARAENAALLSSIPRAGHEVGNHSLSHEPWLHLYPPREVEREVAEAEEAILGATGRRPIGFRGPGFSLSPEVLRVLARRRYLYDASTFPTYVGPLARAFYLRSARLSSGERRERAALFGSFREGFRPLRPYRWRTAEGEVLEIPVTTFPLVRTPIHFSYLLWLGRSSPALARAYLGAALTACRLRGVAPSLLLHPLDFLGGEEAPGLSFFPAMDLPVETKLARMGELVDLLAARFRVVPLEVQAREAAGAPAPLREAA